MLATSASRIGAVRARAAAAAPPACARAAVPATPSSCSSARRRRAPALTVVAGASSSAASAPRRLVGRRGLAAATPLPRARAASRARALHVVAYREHRDVARERAIVALGDRVVGSLMRSLARPPSAPHPTPADVDELSGDTSAHALEARVDGVLESESLKGLDALLAWVERERAAAPECSGGWKLLASAACPTDDAYFALVETLHTSPATGTPPLALHKIIWMDVELDDTKRLVTGVHVRGQLAPDDLSALVSVDSAHRALSATPFPHDRLMAYPRELNVDVPLANQRRWCAARCSSNDARAQLFGDGDALPAIDEARFRLWDAFGTLPVLCDPARRAMPDACVVPGDAVADIIAAAKERYAIDCRMQDAAISLDSNVGFTRWVSVCEDRESGEKFRLEGLEAVVFDEEGKLLDTWLFRDATPAERARLTGA